MVTIKPPVHGLLVLALWSVSTHAAAQGMSPSDQACIEFARIGLVDTVNVRNFEDYTYRMLWYARSEKESTSDSVKSLGASADIPFAKALGSVSGHFDDSEFQSVREMNEQELKQYVHDVVQHYRNETHADPDVARITGECLHRKGLLFYPNFSNNYRTPSITLKFDPPGGASKSVKVNVSTEPGATCLLNNKPIPDPLELHEDQKIALSCTRTGLLDEYVKVTINPAEQVEMVSDNYVWLPPVAPPVACKPARAKSHPARVFQKADRNETKARALFGPYCAPMDIFMSATAKARGNSGGGKYKSRITIYWGDKTDSTARVFTEAEKMLTLANWKTLSAPEEGFTLPAHEQQSFTLFMDDKIADTEDITWLIREAPAAKEVAEAPPPAPSSNIPHPKPAQVQQQARASWAWWVFAAMALVGIFVFVLRRPRLGRRRS